MVEMEPKREENVFLAESLIFAVLLKTLGNSQRGISLIMVFTMDDNV